MLVDSNAYVGHWPFKHLKYNTCETLLGRMNQYGVEASVLSSLDGIFYKNTQPANEELMAAIQSNKAFENRFIPFAVINPIFGGWKNDFDTCINQLGMKGLRLHPQYHGYDLSHPNLVDLVKMAQNRGVPVAFSLRMVDSRPSSWLDIDQEWRLKDLAPIIRQVPDAKYMILNVANSIQLSPEELQLFRQADILLDTSGRQIANLPVLMEMFGKTKFAFGSHAPILDYLTGMLRIESMTNQEADAPTKELLRSGNIQRFLNL